LLMLVLLGVLYRLVRLPRQRYVLIVWELMLVVRVFRERDAGFLGEDLLGTKGHGHGLFGRQRPRFIIRVRVERLRAAEDGGERLDGDARDVVERLLRGRRDPGGLGVGAQAHRLGLLRAVPLLHEPRPDPPRGPELRDLLEEVVVDVEEEREARREAVDVET